MKDAGETNKLSTFKLFKDLLIPQWYRDYYEVQAESLEEAVKIIDGGYGILRNAI